MIQYGFKAVIAPSFADIFYSNSLKNGLVLVTLDEATIDRLFAGAEGTEGYKLTVDLEKKVVIEPDGRETPFEFNEFRRQAIMKGLDDVGITLSSNVEAIREFEAKRLAEKPWLVKTFPGGAE